MKKIAVFAGSDLRNYGGGEKDVIGWVSRLKDDAEIHVYSPIESDINHRVTLEFINERLGGVRINWYGAKKLRLLKDILPLSLFDLTEYDKVYSMCQGFILNSILIRHSKKFILGIHNLNTLATAPIEPKGWKKLLFSLSQRMQLHYVLKSPEIRIQNNDDRRRLEQVGYRGKIWNVPPRMFETMPEPEITQRFYAVWINRVSPEKRPEEIVKIANACPNVEFHIIGSGKSMSVLNDFVNNNARVLGFLGENELQRELAGASVYISTSRGETFGMSAVEAMACGVPTVVYDVMGLRDHSMFIVQNAEEAADRIRMIEKQFGNEGWANYRKKIQLDALERFSDRVVLPQILEMVTA